MPKKLKENYNRPQFNVPADKLIEAVSQYLAVTEGETYSVAKVKEICKQVIEERA